MAEYTETIPTKPGFYVYRFWAGDVCLYVGCVGERGPRRISSRFSQHRRRSPWWPQVTRTEIARLASAAEVPPEERLQVVQLQPVHNKTLRAECSNGHDRTGPGALNDSGQCQECHKAADKRRRRRPDVIEHNRERMRSPGAKVQTAARNRARRRRLRISPNQPGLW